MGSVARRLLFSRTLVRASSSLLSLSSSSSLTLPLIDTCANSAGAYASSSSTVVAAVPAGPSAFGEGRRGKVRVKAAVVRPRARLPDVVGQKWGAASGKARGWCTISSTLIARALASPIGAAAAAAEIEPPCLNEAVHAPPLLKLWQASLNSGARPLPLPSPRGACTSALANVINELRKASPKLPTPPHRAALNLFELPPPLLLPAKSNPTGLLPAPSVEAEEETGRRRVRFAEVESCAKPTATICSTKFLSLKGSKGPHVSTRASSALQQCAPQSAANEMSPALFPTASFEELLPPSTALPLELPL